jgi:enamine deaminase RidA (YjgF/YER057c/UK114 family)
VASHLTQPKAGTIADVVRVLSIVLLVLIQIFPAFAKKKKNGEEVTQVLNLPKDPPAAIVADVAHLTFHVSPLSAKGLLSQQTKDALKHLMQETHGANIVKLRAFVAGSGDLRRIQQIVSEVFTDKHANLPVLSVIQVGSLPMEGAQVVIESIASDKKEQNPGGLAFVSGQPSGLNDPLGPLKTRIEKAGLIAGSVRRLTCFLGNLDEVSKLRTQAAAIFPKAAMDFVQLQRGSLEVTAECEAVAALSSPPAKALNLLEPTPGRYSQAAFVGPGRLALTGTQVGFRAQDADVRLAFERLRKALEGVGASYQNVAMTHIYALSTSIANRIRPIRFEFLDSSKPPASTMLLFEGLPGLDSSFAIDVMAVMP